MKQSTLLWLLAFLLTCVAAYYQRITGPTYPLSEKVVFNGKEIRCALERSHGGETNAVVQIQTNDSSIHGVMEWNKYMTNDEWTLVEMKRAGGVLSAELPHQPPAGKLRYRIALHHNEQSAFVPQNEPAVIRFKGNVPLAILIPHIAAMFGAMFLSARAGLACFSKEAKLKKLISWTLGFLFVGGFILGPLVQLYAFDTLWTGWPIGTDLTDNKTAVALLAWIVAAVAQRKFRRPNAWIVGAAIVTFIVYLIPHSLFGSEIDTKEARRPAIENRTGK
jgi:hypothetical protein